MNNENLDTGIDIEYQIIRSRRKTAAIMVRNGKVEVRAPKYTPRYWIHDFVISRRQWILDQLAEQAEKQLQIFNIRDGATISYLGQPMTIQVISKSELRTAKVLLQSNNIIIQINNDNESNHKSLVKVFDRWLLQQAKSYIPEKCRTLAQELQLQSQLTGVKFRKTKTKWGHCTESGVLQFNQLIMLAPEFVIDYLIVHELCHLRFLNHSKQFWRLVSQYRPQYSQAEDWLKNHGHKLWYN